MEVKTFLNNRFDIYSLELHDVSIFHQNNDQIVQKYLQTAGLVGSMAELDRFQVTGRGSVTLDFGRCLDEALDTGLYHLHLGTFSWVHKGVS